MEVLEIGPRTGEEGSAEQTLYEEFESMVKLDANVFTTWCSAGLPDVENFEFVTTSKDLHLRLGRLSENGRINLARVLETWFRRNPDEEALFRLRVEGEQEGKFHGVMLVTRKGTTGDDLITFHCSQVH